MSTTENRALVQSIMEARARGDGEPFRAAMAEDFVWRMIGSTAWSGAYCGREEVIERLFKPLFATFAGPYAISVDRVLADGDHAVVQCRGEGTTRQGQRYANTYCFVIRLQDGKLKELTEYMDTALVDSVLPPPGLP